MKRLLALALLISCVASAQNFTNGTYKNSFDYLHTLGGTSILNKAYSSGSIDTTQAFNPADFSKVVLGIQAKDSCSIHVKCQLSSDGVTWGALSAELDSLSNANNVGDFKAIDLTTTLLGAYRARLIISQSAFRVGTSSATYSATLLLKKY